MSFSAITRVVASRSPQDGAAIPGDVPAESAAAPGPSRWRAARRAQPRPLCASGMRAAMRGIGGRTSIMQSYRFLRAVLNTAVRDGAIRQNPVHDRRSWFRSGKERPVASPAQVVALVEAITPRYRAAVLLAAWCGLRRGEVLALRPADVDLQAATVTVRHNRVELLESPVAFDADPKTDAGKRTVAIPPHILPVLAAHMAEWAGTDRVFVGRDGSPMRGDAVRQAFTRARARVGMGDFRFHDLRHTGQTLAASTGATSKDLMRRLGHASPAASNRYLHAVEGRDAEIAVALSGWPPTATRPSCRRRSW